jgi:hypothetical protein
MVEIISVRGSFKEVYHQGDNGKTKRHDNGINQPQALDDRRIGRMIQPQGLEGRLESVVQMESQDQEGHQVDYKIHRDLKQLVCKTIKVFVITFHESKPDKPEVDKMDKQENKDNTSCPYHEF